MTRKEREFGFEIPDWWPERRESKAGGREPAAGAAVEDGGRSTLTGPYGTLAGRLEQVRRRKRGCLAQAPSPRGRRS